LSFGGFTPSGSTAGALAADAGNAVPVGPEAAVALRGAGVRSSTGARLGALPQPAHARLAAQTIAAPAWSHRLGSAILIVSSIAAGF
jgi:hypothetical protein